MRSRLRSFVIVGALSATAVAGVATATASPGGGSAPPAATSRTVHLITGDSVLVRTVGGRTSATLAPRAGGSRGYSALHVGAADYVLPSAAEYFAGPVLDPSLFDVSKAGASTTALDVTFPAGARPTIPGLTVTSSTATTLHGYVNAAGTRAFGTALTAQWHHDVQTGLAAPTNLFGATRIAAPAAPATAHPNFPQVTLVVNAINRDGKKLRSGFFGLVNTDDGRKLNAPVIIDKGQGRISVPVGNYSLIGDDTIFGKTSFTQDARIATIPDFAVTKNGQRVTLDFRTATVTPSITTPQPAGLDELSLEWVRTVPNSGLSFSYGYGSQDIVRVAPAPAPTHGQVDWVSTWALDGPVTDGAQYRYDASYDDHGAIPADQSRVFDAAKAGRADETFYSDGSPRDSAFGRAAVYPFDLGYFTLLLPTTSPLVRTDYVEAPSGAGWVDSFIFANAQDDPEQGFVDDDLRTYPAGAEQHIDWLRGPLAPGVAESVDPAYFYCAGCRTDTSLGLSLAPVVDTTVGHYGELFPFDDSTTLDTFRLYRDGKLVSSADNQTFGVVKAPTGSATYRAVVETDRGAAGFHRSTHAVTDLTFVSAAGQGTPLPDGAYCPVRGDDCRVLPLLTATVPLPTDLEGNLPVGDSTFEFTVDGVRGGPALTVPTAKLEISLDGGSTYRSEPVTPLGDGRFRVTITHTAADAGHLVTLRVSGSDTQGGSIVETVTDAYAVGQS